MQIKSKFIALGMILSTLIAPHSIFSAAPSETAKSQSIKEIHAKELKSWIDSGKQFQLVDARPKKFDEGFVIPGAKISTF